MMLSIPAVLAGSGCSSPATAEGSEARSREWMRDAVEDNVDDFCAAESANCKWWSREVVGAGLFVVALIALG
jgi:hypothetical protein